jgi:hypothetical protein
MEWVPTPKLRFGAQLGFGSTLGQEVWGVCRNNLGTCVVGSRKRLPNVQTLAAFGSLSLSYGFGAP